MKKLISLALCAVMAAGSAVCADAAQLKNNNVVRVLDASISVENNTLNAYTYNLPRTTEHMVYFVCPTHIDCLEFKFAECVGNGKSLLPSEFSECSSDCTFQRCFSANRLKTCGPFSDLGGEYVKVRIKLSELDPDYFNSDGSHTAIAGMNYHKFYFVFESGSEDLDYDSEMFFQNGSVVTGVAPDHNGCVEMYMSTKVGVTTDYARRIRYQTKSGNGRGLLEETASIPVQLLTFGNIDLENGVDVNDATALQMYLSDDYAGFDTLQYFYADINRDGIRDVIDVTALQSAIAQ